MMLSLIPANVPLTSINEGGEGAAHHHGVTWHHPTMHHPPPAPIKQLDNNMVLSYTHQ